MIRTRDEFIAALGPIPDGITDLLVSFAEGEAGYYHVLVATEGLTEPACLKLAQAALEVVRGKRAFIRVPPEADSLYDFITSQWQHRGYVRFTFRDEPGEWEHVQPMKIDTGELRYVGLAR